MVETSTATTTERATAPALEADLLAAKLDRFTAMVSGKDRALLDELWGDGEFCMIGSERGEICPTRETLDAKLKAIFASPGTLFLEFPEKRIRIVGNVGWIFSAGVLRRRDSDGLEKTRDYLVTCIFEKSEGVWRWRQFFGSEPY